MQFKPPESERSDGGGERGGRKDEEEGSVERRGGGGGGEVFRFNPLICPNSSAESFRPRREDELRNCAKLCFRPVRDEQSRSLALPAVQKACAKNAGN